MDKQMSHKAMRQARVGDSNYVVILFLAFMSVYLSGWLGLVVFFFAGCVGLLAPLTGVSRTHAMGCLLLPTLVFLW